MKGGEDYYSSLVVNAFLNAFSGLTALVFNIITIHAIRKTSTLPKILKALLLSLAVSDLGVGLLVQPFQVARLFMKLKESTNNSAYFITDKAFLVSANIFAFASVFGVTILSADRFLVLHFHLRYQELVTHKRIVTAVVSVWVSSAFLSLVRQLIPKNIIFFIFFMIFVVCLVTLAFLNYKIFVVVRHHEHQIQALQFQHTAQNVQMANVGRVRKSAVTTLYIYLVFLLCYLPNTCILVMNALTTYQPLYAVIQNYAQTLPFLNSSLNPLIYCWRTRDIRHNVIDILRTAAGRN